MIADACLLIASCLAAGGCSGLPKQFPGSHPMRHVEGLEALHAVQGGDVPLVPGLKWVDVTSVLASRGDAPSPRPGRLLKIAILAGSRRVEWQVRTPGGHGLSEDAWKRRVDFATRYLAGLCALGDKGLVLELELVPDGVGVDATRRSLYFDRPRLHFYLPFSSRAEHQEETTSAMAALSTVIHELVHFKLLHTFEGDMFDEEVAASTAELCFFLEGMLHEEQIEAVRIPGSMMLSDQEIDGIVKRYGNSVAGTALARRRLLEERVEGGQVRLSRDDLPWLRRKCIHALEDVSQ